MVLAKLGCSYRQFPAGYFNIKYSRLQLRILATLCSFQTSYVEQTCNLLLDAIYFRTRKQKTTEGNIPITCLNILQHKCIQLLDYEAEALYYCDDIVLQSRCPKPQSSHNLLFYRTQPCNSTPENTRILQPLLSVRLFIYFQRNHNLLLFSFYNGSYDRK